MSLPVTVLFLTSILWGLSWIPLKALNNSGFGGISLILLSFTALSLILSPVLYSQRQRWWNHKQKLLLIALLGGGANLAFAYALIYGDVVRVMVLFYLLPIWGVLGGHLLLHEIVDRRRWFGVILALTGAFIVLGAFQILRQPPSWIDLVSIAAGFFLAMTILMFRATQQVPVTSKITAMFYGCSVLALLLMTITNEPYATGDSVSDWAGLLAYAICWLLVANLGSQWAVTHMETGRASIIIILELVAAVVSATIIRGEVMSLNEIIGGAMILAAALIEAVRDTRDIKPVHTPL